MELRLIAGLGNPGRKYESTRHNIGFMLIDYMVDHYGISLEMRGFEALWVEGEIGGQVVMLVKPQTFMNLSGQSLRLFKDFFRLHNREILVVYDDMDLPFGRLRIRPRGGAGGHRGMISVIEALGGEDFPRLRMGIGRPERGDAVSYVLSPFEEDERKRMDDFLEAGRMAVETCLVRGIDEAMNRFNSFQLDQNP